MKLKYRRVLHNRGLYLTPNRRRVYSSSSRPGSRVIASEAERSLRVVGRFDFVDRIITNRCDYDDGRAAAGGDAWTADEIDDARPREKRDVATIRYSHTGAEEEANGRLR